MPISTSTPEDAIARRGPARLSVALRLAGDNVIADVSTGSAIGTVSSTLARSQTQSETEERVGTRAVTPCAYTLFQQPWWLDAVAPGQWHTVTVRHGTEIAARLPYVLRKKLGLVLVTQPPLT